MPKVKFALCFVIIAIFALQAESSTETVANTSVETVTAATTSKSKYNDFSVFFTVLQRQEIATLLTLLQRIYSFSYYINY